MIIITIKMNNKVHIDKSIRYLKSHSHGYSSTSVGIKVIFYAVLT